MKKIVAMMLALMLVLVSVSALAATSGTKTDSKFPVDMDPASEQTITITKGYIINDDGDNTTDKHPADTITFTEDASKRAYYFNGVKDSSVTVPALKSIVATTVSEDTNKATITVTLPKYTGPVGEYVYYLVETDAKTAGVTYNYTATNPLVLKVTLINETDQTTGEPTGNLLIGGIALRDGTGDDAINAGNAEENAKKLDSSTGSKDDVHNEYEKGQLTVSKKVTGNMGDTTKKWIFKAVFTSETGKTVRGTINVSGSGTYCGATQPTVDANGNVTPTAVTGTILPGENGWTGDHDAVYFTLTSGQNMVFDNLPKGMTYAITEVEAGMYGYTTTATASDTVVKDETKDADSQAEDAQVTGGITEKAQADTANFTNNKQETPDTGIALDTVPYLMIMAIALMGVAMMIVRRREEM